MWQRHHGLAGGHLRPAFVVFGQNSTLPQWGQNVLKKSHIRIIKLQITVRLGLVHLESMLNLRWRRIEEKLVMWTSGCLCEPPCVTGRLNRMWTRYTSLLSRKIEFMKKQSVRESYSKLTAFPVKMPHQKRQKSSISSQGLILGHNFIHAINVS